MKPNSKVLGAFVIGFAMVAGSYVVTHFGEKPAGQTKEGVYALVAAKGIDHPYIAETDKNNDGTPDWQEEFVDGPPLIIDTTTNATSTYVIPNTVTDHVGIQLFQSVLEAKTRGGVGPDKTKIINDTADLLRKSTIKDVIYTTTDITVIDSSPEAIRTYANTLGEIIANNNVPGSENELTIMKRAVQTGEQSELDKLDPIIAMYKNLRDQTKATPVPHGFEKQHLDLINVYQGVYATLDGMKLVFTDPVVALLRIKRYQDDATGLAYALQNMYTALVPYANLLQPNDPAGIFAVFAPKK